MWAVLLWVWFQVSHICWYGLQPKQYYDFLHDPDNKYFSTAQLEL